MKRLFFMLIIRPLILFVMGLHVRGRDHLQCHSPCIVVANHNSHLDTLILMSLFPLSMLENIRPLAAADYFLKNRLSRWLAINLIGIIPVERNQKSLHEHPLKGAMDALRDNQSIIIFPEGSRGEPEQMTHFKTGVAHLAKAFPDVAVLPVNIYGAGKSLPRGEALFVPFIADVVIGEPFYFGDTTAAEFTKKLEDHIRKLGHQSQKKDIQ